jgi:hypothetical protein
MRRAAAAVTLLTAVLSVGLSVGARADDPAAAKVVWQTIKGNPVANNTAVGGIPSGTDPWSTLSGSADVDLTTDSVAFSVKGLVFAAESVIGTTGPVTKIKGTLVCGPASSAPKVVDTPNVALSAQGNATFTGVFKTSTATCKPTDVAFLIRNVANNRWIAFGAVRVP